MSLNPMKVVPPLDPGFVSAALSNRAYRRLVSNDPTARAVEIALVRPDGAVFRHALGLLGQVHPEAQARAIYETIGVCFGHAIAHNAEFYDLSHVPILGRVTSGEGGDIILERARAALAADFPALAERISFHTPDENNKRHGQAVAAASLPALANQS